MNKYNHLSQKERIKIYELKQSGMTIRKIALTIKRSASTVSREIKRNAWKGTYYLPDLANSKYLSRYTGRPRKIIPDSSLYYYIRNKLILGWSPEAISGRMRYANKEYYVCHETIYNYIYKSRLGKEWYKYLTKSKPYRGKRMGRKVGSGKYLNIKLINTRPDISSRSEIGHWEGDTIGFSTSKYQNITTLVERKSRLVIMIKNEDRKSNNVMGAIASYLQDKKKSMFKTITVDQGSEFAHFRIIETTSKCNVFFANPHSPWQRGTNENTNGRIRRFLPRSALIDNIDQDYVDTLANKMNNFPRKILGYMTPKEAFKLNFKSKRCTSN